MSIIKLIYGSCADQTVDIVVNAANRELLPGGGICGAIFKKAGYTELYDACKQFSIPLNDGDAVITSSFNMNNARYIIHAVGPNFAETPNAFDKLYLAYYNSMELVKKHMLRSISFPLISSGIFGGNLDNPAKESTKQCIKAYLDYSKEYKDYSIEVLLCAYTEKEYIEAKETFKEYGLDKIILDRCKKLNILTNEDVAIWHEPTKIDENTFSGGFSEYNENVTEWIHQMYDLDLTVQNYQEKYDEIKDKEFEELTIEDILTIFTFYIRGDRFSDGFLDEGIKSGKLVKLSERLNKLANEQ